MDQPSAEIKLADNGGVIVEMYIPPRNEDDEDDEDDDDDIDVPSMDSDWSSRWRKYVFPDLDSGLDFIKKNLPKAATKQDAMDAEAEAGMKDAMRAFGGQD